MRLESEPIITTAFERRLPPHCQPHNPENQTFWYKNAHVTVGDVALPSSSPPLFLFPTHTHSRSHFCSLQLTLSIKLADQTQTLSNGTGNRRRKLCIVRQIGLLVPQHSVRRLVRKQLRRDLLRGRVSKKKTMRASYRNSYPTNGPREKGDFRHMEDPTKKPGPTRSRNYSRFWNTISNMASLFAAGVGYHFFPTRERRFKYLFWTFYLVGLGSTLFHGTLRHKMQLLGKKKIFPDLRCACGTEKKKLELYHILILENCVSPAKNGINSIRLTDELPMLYSATIILFILVEAKHGPQGRWFPFFLVGWIGKKNPPFCADLCFFKPPDRMSYPVLPLSLFFFSTMGQCL